MNKHLEDDLQAACVKWFDLQYGNSFLLFAVPNGGKRNVREAARLKRQGVRAGIPDLCLAVPTKLHHGAFFELKAGKNILTETQKTTMLVLENKGYACYLIRSLDEFMKSINTYFKYL